jgi:hypothetical protein
MLTKEPVAAAYRVIESDEEFQETRLEAVGFVFHGKWPVEGQPAPRGGANQLHFARCAKLDRASDTETKVWFRSIRVAKQHLDDQVGTGRWKWCKICQREITQRILNEP